MINLVQNKVVTNVLQFPLDRVSSKPRRKREGQVINLAEYIINKEFKIHAFPQTPVLKGYEVDLTRECL